MAAKSTRDGQFARLSVNINNTTEISCTNPVDRIFAVLRISPKLNVEPNYERPPEAIFTSTTKAIIQQEQSLNILCFSCNKNKSQREGRLPYLSLPSFVPHYEAVLDMQSLINCMETRESPRQPYDCGGPFTSTYRPNTPGSESERSLLISGCSWGKLVYKATPADLVYEDSITKENWPEIRNWYTELRTNLFPESDAVDNWKALFEDVYPLPSSDLPLVAGYYRTMSKHAEAEAYFKADLIKALEHDNNPPDMFLKMLNRRVQDRSVFVLDRGDIVKAANTVEVGDEVFVARGCSCALVLRAVSEVRARLPNEEAAACFLDVQVREFFAGAYVRDTFPGANVDVMNGEVYKLMNDGYEEEIKILLI